MSEIEFGAKDIIKEWRRQDDFFNKLKGGNDKIIRQIMEATEKQINYAKTLGIDNPEQYSKLALSEMIDKKTGGSGKPKWQGKSLNRSNPVVTETTTITKTDKPHSFEAGKAGARHKIYYNNVEELVFHIEMLKNAGLMDTVETVKPEDAFTEGE